MSRPQRSYQRWSPEEDAQLVVEMSQPHVTLDEIALQHGRDVYAIIAHKQVLAAEEVLGGQPMDEQIVEKYRLTEEEVLAVTDEIELAQTGEISGGRSVPLRRAAPRKKSQRIQLQEALDRIQELEGEVRRQALEIRSLETQRAQLTETVLNLSRQ